MSTRLRPQQQALQERILRGAASAFARLGHSATRVEDIVQDTGISRPTFYKLFDSKDAVFETLSANHHRTIRERLLSASQSSDVPSVQLERTVEAFLRWRAELGPVGRVLDAEARMPGSRLAQHRKRTLAFVIDLSQAGLLSAGRARVDPVLIRALVVAAENVADDLFTESKVTERTFQRARAIVLRIHLMALAQPGDPTPPLPRMLRSS